ncbi:MAG: RNA pseudouridine synthase [Flammeovirgaceae bacterium]
MKINDSNILLSDHYVFAINKPSGIMVEDDNWGNPSIMQIVKAYWKEKNEKGISFVQNVHRIDRPVSGALLFARKASSLRNLQTQFEQKKVKKIYLALTTQKPEKEEGILFHFLIKDFLNKKALISEKPVPQSNAVRLKYKLLGSKNNLFCWEIELITGKYHQIRAQWSHIGCPVIGDIKYNSDIEYLPESIALHSYQLHFEHPKTKELVCIKAPLPKNKFWDNFEYLNL